MDILRDLRRRSLQLDSGDVERFRSPSERRGSMASDSLSAAEKKGHSSGGLLHRFFTLSPYVFFFLFIFSSSLLFVRKDPSSGPYPFLVEYGPYIVRRFWPSPAKRCRQR